MGSRNCCFASIGAMLSFLFIVVLFCPLLTSSKNAIKANVDPVNGQAFQSDQNLKMEPAFHSDQKLKTEPAFHQNLKTEPAFHSNLKMEPAPEFDSKDICGDPECDLVCAEGQECRPTGDQCVMPPCCVAWHCVDLRLLSKDQPWRMMSVPPNGLRWPKAAPPMDFPASTGGRYVVEKGFKMSSSAVKREISKGYAKGEGESWQMIWVDSLCDIGLPCPTTTTTRKGFN